MFLFFWLSKDHLPTRTEQIRTNERTEQQKRKQIMKQLTRMFKIESINDFVFLLILSIVVGVLMWHYGHIFFMLPMKLPH